QLSCGAASRVDLRALKNQKAGVGSCMADTPQFLSVRNLIVSLAASRFGEVLTMPQPHAAAYVEPPLPPGPTGVNATTTLSSLNHASLSLLRATSPKNGHWRINATLSAIYAAFC